MASAIRGVPWYSENEPGNLLDMPWELYNVEEDFSQANDLAQQNPETLDIRFDTGTPVAEGYEMPFQFTGKLSAVTIELK